MSLQRNKSQKCFPGNIPIPHHPSLPTEQCGWHLVPVQASECTAFIHYDYACEAEVLASLLHSVSCLVESQKLRNVQNALFALSGHKILSASIVDRLQLGL